MIPYLGSSDDLTISINLDTMYTYSIHKNKILKVKNLIYQKQGRYSEQIYYEKGDSKN